MPLLWEHLSQNFLVNVVSEHDNRGFTHCCVVGGDDLSEVWLSLVESG